MLANSAVTSWWIDLPVGAVFVAIGLPWVLGMREPGGRPTFVGKVMAWTFVVFGAVAVLSGLGKAVGQVL